MKNKKIEYNDNLAALDPYNDIKKSKPKNKKDNRKSNSIVVKARAKAQENDIHYPYMEKSGVIVKPTGTGKNAYLKPVVYGVITDYRVLRQYGDCGSVIHEITLKHEGKFYKYKGISTEEIRDYLCNNNFGTDRKMVLNFLNMTLGTLRNEISKYGILGGYSRLEDIPKPKSKSPANYVAMWMKQNLGVEQLRLFKSLILLPYHKIIRNDETAQPRGLVRAVIGQGDSDQLKSFTVNFQYNFHSTHVNVPLSENRSSDSLPALRNDCHNNTGILMCDEADKLIVDWTGDGRITYEAGNFIKRIEQSRSINVSDLNNQGNNMGSLLNATPVFLWNNFISYVDPALNDRLLICDFHKENKPDIKDMWSLRKGKNQMLRFGEHISHAFKTKYDDIKTSDAETATNIIIDYLMEEYDYDLQFLKEIKFKYASELYDPVNIHDNIISALRSYIVQTKLYEKSASEQLQDNQKFKSHLSYCTSDVLRIKCKSFTDWVNKKVLKGGETTAEEIADMFDWEIKKYNNSNVFIVSKSSIEQMLDLEEDEEVQVEIVK